MKAGIIVVAGVLLVFMVFLIFRAVIKQAIKKVRESMSDPKMWGN